MNKGKQSILAISGLKNTGKTTLITRLIPKLQALGISVAVIKHDGHSFLPDTEGTDTYRHYAAGAQGVAIFDGEKYMVVKTMAVDETYLGQLFPEVDLILLEGFKYSAYPKLELVLETPVCPEETVIAYVSDGGYRVKGKQTFQRDELEEIAQFMVKGIRDGRFFAQRN